VLLGGATSSGKTHRVILPAAVQIVRRREASVVVFDLKGDKALFYRLASEASKAGMNFRWINLDTGSSYVFNPLTMRFFDRLSGDAQVQLIAQALGLDGQDRQADVFFSDLNERILRRFYQRRRPRSFRSLLEAIEQPGGAGHAEVTAREWDLAMHLRAALDRLAAPLPLNAEAVGPGVTSEMLSGAVDLDDLLSRPEVLYFWLPSTVQRAASRACARLGIQSLVTAARTFQGNRLPVHVFADEFQEVVGTAAVDGLLRQARDFGLSFWLACQQLSALQQGQHDCLDAVTGNVALQIHFTATDRTGHEHLIRLSGETTAWLRGEAETDGGLRTQAREVVRARVTSDDVSRLNASPDLAAAIVTPYTPLAPFRHPFFLRTTFVMSAREFDRLRALPFPHPTRFTVFNRSAEPVPRVEPTPPARPVADASGASQRAAPPPPVSRPSDATVVSAGDAAEVSPRGTESQSPASTGTRRPVPEPAKSRSGQRRERKPSSPAATPPVAPSAPVVASAPPTPVLKSEVNSDLANYLKQLRIADAVAVTKPSPPRPE